MLKTEEEFIQKDDNSVGVFVGRFQAIELTDGHKQLFDTVISRHQKTICVIGLSEIRASKMNPLDFESRRIMIQKDYPDVEIYYIKDLPNDKKWSKKLDFLISDHTPPNTNVVLYGSRDSFISRYYGRHKTKELMQEVYTTATNCRSSVAFKSGDTEEWRKGAIWATQNQYDAVFPTVDVAIIHEEKDAVLLGRKEHEDKYRFVGGFVEPKGDSENGLFLEEHAKREACEETGLEIDNLEYVGSFLVDDWRYRYENSKIATTLFLAKYIYGSPKPQDDINELRWFQLSQLKDDEFIVDNIVKEHVPLMKKLIGSIDTLTMTR